jgi:hypothetical protein
MEDVEGVQRGRIGRARLNRRPSQHYPGFIFDEIREHRS